MRVTKTLEGPIQRGKNQAKVNGIAPKSLVEPDMINGHLLGLYEKALPPEWDWEKRLGIAKELGFDYVEISIDETDERLARLYWDKAQRTELLLTCNKLGMPLRSMCLSAHRRFSFGTTDGAARNRAHELMERAIGFAEDLGIRVIQLAGYDVYYESSTRQSVEAFLEGMKWSAKLAEKHQVMLAMEIMDTPFMNSITKHLRYENTIKSPWYKTYPDLGNLSAWGNDVEKELEKGISSIVGVHIKDTIAVTDTFPGQFKRVPFGAGCVDFVKSFAKLEHLDYRGPYLIEMWNDPSIDNVEAIRKALRFINDKYDWALKQAAK
jgi:hexulose-6-phosphate isomerase